MLHTENDIWTCLGSSKGGGNVSTRSKKQSSGCQHGGSSAQHFHKYDISDYPLLSAAGTHQHFGGVGGGKRAYSEMEMAGEGYHMKKNLRARKTCDRLKIMCSVHSVLIILEVQAQWLGGFSYENEICTEYQCCPARCTNVLVLVWMLISYSGNFQLPSKVTMTIENLFFFSYREPPLPVFFWNGL